MKKTFKLLALVAMASALALCACTKDDEPNYSYTDGGSGSDGGGGTQTRPTASFSVSSSNIMVGNTVSFTNYSSNATSYYWDFGDFEHSSERNPTHQYTYASNFNVELIAYNNSYTSTATKTIRAVNPNYCTINSLRLNRWASRMSNGNVWDGSAGAAYKHPDIYFVIKNSAGTQLFKSQVVDDCIHPDDGGTITPSYSVGYKMGVNENYTIEFWDEDALVNEGMVSVNCNPLIDDFYYPFSSSITMQTTSGEWRWTMNVTWSLY